MYSPSPDENDWGVVIDRQNDTDVVAVKADLEKIRCPSWIQMSRLNWN